MRYALLTFAALLLTVPAARADYAVLRSGQRLHITGYERDGEMVRLQLEGGSVEVSAADLVAVEPEDFFPAPLVAAPTGPFGKIIRDAAKKNGVDEALVSSVIAAESNFNPRAVSRKQARGLMQLMPQTAARFSVSNAFDPTQNVDAGSRYLRELLERYNGDLGLTLAAYNAGPKSVEQYGGVPPFAETHAYVRRVERNLADRKKKASKNGGSASPAEPTSPASAPPR
jgi:soluble lytic murein transglycosylase-like protein